MSLTYKITKAYRNKEIIPACCVGYKEYIEGRSEYLPIRFKNTWVYDHKPPVKDYKNYSHTFCPDEFNKLISNLENK